MADPIQFSRRPYTVKYIDLNGEMQTIRRKPPPKLHNIWPQDEVNLKEAKNADWEEGEYSVSHINPKHPNVIQIENSDGQKTFVDYYNLELERAFGNREGKEAMELAINNKYLLWP